VRSGAGHESLTDFPTALPECGQRTRTCVAPPRLVGSRISIEKFSFAGPKATSFFSQSLITPPRIIQRLVRLLVGHQACLGASCELHTSSSHGPWVVYPLDRPAGCEKIFISPLPEHFKPFEQKSSIRQWRMCLVLLAHGPVMSS
jgi:hypothetical protein